MTLWKQTYCKLIAFYWFTFGIAKGCIQSLRCDLLFLSWPKHIWQMWTKNYESIFRTSENQENSNPPIPLSQWIPKNPEHSVPIDLQAISKRSPSTRAVRVAWNSFSRNVSDMAINFGRPGAWAWPRHDTKPTWNWKLMKTGHGHIELGKFGYPILPPLEAGRDKQKQTWMYFPVVEGACTCRTIFWQLHAVLHSCSCQLLWLWMKTIHRF